MSAEPTPLTVEQLLPLAVALEYRQRQHKRGQQVLLRPLPPCPTCNVVPDEVITGRSPSHFDLGILFEHCGHRFTVGDGTARAATQRAVQIVDEEEQRPAGEQATFNPVAFHEAAPRLGVDAPDLHGWISQQIDKVEAAARDATEGPWFAEHLEGAWGEEHDAVLIGQGKPLATLPYDHNGHLNADHFALNDPAAVLRRCAADRKILARHKPHTTGSTDCVVRCERAHWNTPVCNWDGHTWPCADVTDLATALRRPEDPPTSKEQA